ncbi:glyoxalase/bleomycin resistance/extradiol dioxygenase family protein [Nesterenkonia sp. Act20]|uniref:VOC family protein n=1 Tax=Nesterenkonia sp. Act20 TaxID=1483432 RepID=UPI001C4641C2|nr:VOC family protein [Nesterenkonia sp. Act20]
MSVRSAFAILTTDDLERLVGFYRAAFDAEPTYRFPDDEGRDVYVTLSIGEASLGIGRESGPTRVTSRMTLWFYVDDLDLVYRRALDAGGIAVREPAEMPWGERVAQILDPDGFSIHLGAVD